MTTVQIVNLVLDGVFALFIAFIVIRHCVKGLLKSLISLVKIVVAPVAAVVFNLPLARIVSSLFDGMCVNWVHKLLLTTETTELIEGVETTLYDVDTIFEGIPNMITRFLLRAGENESTKSFIDKFFNSSDGNVPELAELESLGEISNIIGSRIALGISIIITFLVIFIVVEIALIILGKILNKLVSKVTIIKVLNIILGGVIGAAIALLVTWAACFGIGQAFEFGAHYYPDIFIDDYWNGTLIVKFFIEHDLLEIVKTFAIK